MNKWYRSALTKGILILLMHILVITAMISLVGIARYPGGSGDILSVKGQTSYEESEAFLNQISYDSSEILKGINIENNLVTDGKLDETRIVDIEEFNDTHTVSNENKSGLAYTVKDLLAWKDAKDKGEVSANAGSSDIIVCEKTDGTYDYLTYEELSNKIESGELKFFINDESYTSDDILNDLKGNAVYQYGDEGLFVVQDSEDRMIYSRCWNYDGYWLDEVVTPVDAKSIIEVVNESPTWNGRLDEAVSQIETAMDSISAEVTEYELNQDRWKQGNTNLTYLYVDNTNKKVYSNHTDYMTAEKTDEAVAEIQTLGKYVVVKPELVDFSTNIDMAVAKTWRQEVSQRGDSDDFVFAVGVDTTYKIQDDYYTQDQLFAQYAPKIRMILVMGILSVIAILIILVWLTAVAGRRPKDEELHLHGFDKWKTELAAFVVCVPWIILFGTTVSRFSHQIIGETYSAYEIAIPDIMTDMSFLVIVSFIAVFTCAAFLVGYLSLVRRIKAKTIWKNSILRALCHFVGQFFSNIGMVWKVALAFLGFVLLHWIAMGSGGSGGVIFVMLIGELVAFIYLIRRAIGKVKIRRGLERIAGGEVDYKIPVKELHGSQKIIAERINGIGAGLDAAVEASMKNERLKTDLITNVSHDIKTPLTSIINYIELLRRENFTDPKIIGYLDVLEAKAMRLKTLTEDVVEASKVSSGNITLEYMNINLVEMIQQTSGEFEEKFKKRDLQEVLSLPNEDAVIRVDGRRLWRILENIYNNAAKYAMEGTRIYADLDVTETQVLFSLKNISEQSLNITADELTERFIRGDISRSTEGSGLGLSIAKSLTEMQGGKFDLYLDGDLFRVTIMFPRLVKENPIY